MSKKLFFHHIHSYLWSISIGPSESHALWGVSRSGPQQLRTPTLTLSLTHPLSTRLLKWWRSPSRRNLSFSAGLLSSTVFAFQPKPSLTTSFFFTPIACCWQGWTRPHWVIFWWIHHQNILFQGPHKSTAAVFFPCLLFVQRPWIYINNIHLSKPALSSQRFPTLGMRLFQGFCVFFVTY